MPFHQLKISHRLVLGFGLLLMLTCILCGLAYFRVHQINDDLRVLLEDRYPKIVALHDIKDTLNHSNVNLMALALEQDPAARTSTERQLQDDGTLIAKRMGELDHVVHLPKGRLVLAQLQQHHSAYLQQRGRFIALVDAEDKEAALSLLLGDLRAAQLRYFSALEQLISFQTELMAETVAQTEDETANTASMLIVLGLCTLLSGASIAVVIARSITAPLTRAIRLAAKIADGDLTTQIDARGKDETSQLLQALQTMSEQLSGIVRRVEHNSSQIALSAREIAAGNLNLSSRTEQQAAALQESAASLESVVHAAHQSAEHARAAHQLAEQTAHAAHHDGRAVEQLVSQMAIINQVSHQIADITGAIDSIAFQTNILALNAAVEAARAGEQGRGFAVVATEVRTLAQRAAAAAKDIRKLSANASDRIADGVVMVERTGSGIADIERQAQSVSAVMGNILDASLAQSSGLDQIQQAINEIDLVTQQNAALVEQAAAAAASMQEQGFELVQAVGVFQLPRQGSRDTPAGTLRRPVAALALT